MRIIGVDPGSLVTGWGVVDREGSRLSLVDLGCIRNSGTMKMPQRFAAIYEALTDIFKKHEPEQMAIEGLFFCKNVSSAIKLGEARGIAMLVAAQREVEVFEYAPRRVRQAVLGRGGAQKGQVQYMVKALLGLEEKPQPADAADALAIALCHALSRGGE